MSRFIKSVVLFPVIAGSALGGFARLSHGWAHGELMVWSAYLLLMIAVWFPFILVPYLKRRRSRF
jgi:hypothetical protein